MDIDRFRQAQANANAQLDYNAQWVKNFFNQVTNYWINYVIGLINQIQDKYLDSIITNKIKKEPNAKTLQLIQSIRAPLLVFDDIKFNDILYYNYIKHPDIFNTSPNNTDLWKNTNLKYGYKNHSIIAENLKYSEYNNTSSYKTEITLKIDYQTEYVNRYFIPWIQKRLTDYRLNILEIKWSCGNIYITIKNPVYDTRR